MSQQHYQSDFWLTEKLGNNAFDYKERSTTNPEPSLYIAPLQQFSTVTEALQQLEVSNHISFEVNEEDQIKSFPGLKNFLAFPNLQNPQGKIYIFDNHNHAFYFWHLQRTNGSQQNQSNLIHIDQHKDSRIPATFLTEAESQDLQQVFQYTNEILNVGNFIPPAFQTKLIKEMLLVDSSQTLEQFPFQQISNQQPEQIILDIDIDFFDPALDYIDNQQKLNLIKKLLPLANTVTIATSPFFIKQDLAFEYIKKIFS